MQIEIKIDPSCTEPKIIVVAESMSEEVQNLVKRLSVDVPQGICSDSGNSVVGVAKASDLCYDLKM